MKKSKFLSLLIFLTLGLTVLTGCQGGSDGGGVVNKEEPNPGNNPPPFEGPFGGPINDDEAINPASPYLTPYDSFELTLLIANADSGDVIELDRDVELFSTVFIDKPLTITSAASLGRNAKIKQKLGSNMQDLFSIAANNVTFKKIDLEPLTMVGAINIENFGPSITYSDFTLDQVNLFLRGISTLTLRVNNLTIKNSNIFGLSATDIGAYSIASTNDPKPLVRLSGNNLSLVANNILDVKNSYTTALFLEKSNSSLIKNNVIRSFSRVYFGTITGLEVSNVNLEGNTLHDANLSRTNNLGYPDPAADGSIALAFQDSSNINDNGLRNSFAANHFIITDADAPGDLPPTTSGVSLLAGLSIPDFGPNQLFNFPSTEDFHPVCAVGTNPMLKTTATVGLLSYLTQSAGTLYYTGPILPACIAAPIP